MENGTLYSQPLSQSHCEVCSKVLSFHDCLQIKDLDYSVCQSFNCRNIMGKKASMNSLMFKSHLTFQQKVLHKHLQKEAARKRRIEQAISRESLENQRVVECIKHDHTELSRNHFQLVVIPTGLSQLSTPSDERVNNYIEHLNNIICEAAGYSSTDEVIYDQHQDARVKLLKIEQRFSQNPALKKLSDQLCGTCKGGCCISGKEHAYLSVFSMRSMMDKKPDLSITDILDKYLSHLSPETVENSCINQTQTGCALPRELRSDICNAFYCDPVKNGQNEIEKHPTLGKVLAIQRSNTYSSRFDPDAHNEITSASIIDEDNSQLIKIPKGSRKN